jgi:ribosomal protein S18 acetylase RimI-like enzyme
MLISGYDIEPIDLERSAELCVAFRRDSYVCSFGDQSRFIADHGPDGAGYLDWLRTRIGEFPAGHVHVWQGRQIVGQMEMRVRDGVPTFLYVNLFYVIPAERGTGVGEVLHRYALHVGRAQGFTMARLGVSPSNQRALAYYRKHGWRDLGRNPAKPGVHAMELDLAVVDTKGA